MIEKVWLAADDDECWSNVTPDCATRAEAIECAPEELALEPGQRFWTGWKQSMRYDDLVTQGLAEHISERIAEAATADLCTDACPGAEDWLKLTCEEATALAKLLSRAVQDFIDAHPQHRPNWFFARDVQEHRAP